MAESGKNFASRQKVSIRSGDHQVLDEPFGNLPLFVQGQFKQLVFNHYSSPDVMVSMQRDYALDLIRTLKTLSMLHLFQTIVPSRNTPHISGPVETILLNYQLTCHNPDMAGIQPWCVVGSLFLHKLDGVHHLQLGPTGNPANRW
jgi:hypothetical protein